MGKSKLDKLLIIYLIIIIIISITGSGIIFISDVKSSQEVYSQNTINQIRVKINPLYQFCIDNFEGIIEGNTDIFEGFEYKEDTIFTVTDPAGYVYFTNSSEIAAGKRLDLMEALYYDKSHSKDRGALKTAFPLIKDNIQLGNLIVEFGKEDVPWFDENKSNRMLVIIFYCSMAFSIVATVYIMLYTQKHIKVPAAQINNSLLNVSKGVYKKAALEKGHYFEEIIISYNTMIEELTYLLKKQQDYDGMRKQFFTMISHELKTPIAAIGAYAEGLKNNIAKDEETRQKYIDIIYHKINNLTYQIEDLFKYSQQDVNRFKINLNEGYAYQSFEKIFASFENQYRDKGVKITIENMLPNCLIHIDEIRMEQVIQNLVNNALKHVDQDGEIRISAYRQENEIIIAIKDNGEGISPRDLPYIFDYFYQGKNSKQSDYQGVGLGLAICKDIIEKHRGNIKVRSSENKGSIFYISLPVI